MGRPARALAESAAIAEMEVRKILRDPAELFSRSVQPVLWLLIFGKVFSQVRGIPTGTVSYLAFLAPGVLAQSVLFSAIFFGIAIIWERDLGIVHKLLVSPAERAALVLGKAIAAAFRGLIQAAIVYALALAMGIELHFEPLNILGVVASVGLGAATFATFSLIIACLVKTRERFMGIGQLLTMPLFFASNAIYPIEIMPPWLKVVARLNPLTYMVDSLRELMIVGSGAVHGLAVDYAVLSGVFIAMLALATRLYPRIIW